MNKDDKNGSSSQEVRRVAPIRVVNLASLQDIKVISEEMPARISRRKSVHQVRSNSDDQIEFIESQAELSNDDNSTSTIASSSNSANAFRKSVPGNVKRTSATRIGRQEIRPNENLNLMKRVALLRVCAEYMLNELNVENVIVGENQSLEMLKAQYFRNSRRNH